MCPPDPTSDKPDNNASTGTADGNADAAQEQNYVVGPLTDDELLAGGMDRVVAFVRTKRSKEALRKEKQRKKQHDNGTRQINLDVPNNDRSRATMRGAAIAIKDEVSHQAIELLLANEDLRPLIVGAAARPEIREIVGLIRQRQATTNSLNAAKLIINDPDLATLVERAIATGRVREAMEVAAANPEFVFFGRNAATERSPCAWLARLLLRVRRTRRAGP
ncbi:MAG: hypothetical protein K2Y19_21640 [Afipia birgiae]|jgi:hypothetical protein|nr:hypothetical protein [Afipia birgiae]